MMGLKRDQWAEGR